MALNNPPEFQQNQSYTARRWRRAVERMSRVQPGVWDGLTVTRPGGWVYNVAAGNAFVPATLGATNTGLYHVETDASPVLDGLVTPAHATLPRIDQLVIQVNDATDSGSVDDVQRVTMLDGVATSGATLTNRTGAVALPANCLRLYDVLVPAGAASAQAATWRDRRPRARGHFSIQTVSAGNVSVAANSTVPMATVRCEIGQAGSGSNLVEFGMWVNQIIHPTAGAHLLMLFEVSTNDGGTWSTIGGRTYDVQMRTASYARIIGYFDTQPFAAGHYMFRSSVTNTSLSSGATVTASANNPYRFWVREILSPADIQAVNSV